MGRRGKERKRAEWGSCSEGEEGGSGKQGRLVKPFPQLALQ